MSEKLKSSNKIRLLIFVNLDLHNKVEKLYEVLGAPNGMSKQDFYRQIIGDIIDIYSMIGEKGVNILKAKYGDRRAIEL